MGSSEDCVAEFRFYLELHSGEQYVLWATNIIATGRGKSLGLQLGYTNLTRFSGVLELAPFAFPYNFGDKVHKCF